jgi:hypothetical protein
MHWVLQENLFNERAYDTLVDTLVRFNIPHSLHKVVPFAGDLIPEPNVASNNVICFGSYSMRHYAARMGWNPGVFDLESMTFQVQLLHWGQHMLNHDSVCSAFRDAKVEDVAFIRPVADSKVFAGMIIASEDLTEWQHNVCVLEEDDGTSLRASTEVQVCSLKEIYEEVRFWVVKGQIVTASVYKRGDKVIYLSGVDDAYFDYVKERIAEWQPAEAFVIDVAWTQHGFAIVEINTLNAAGFYAADIQKLVFSLEQHFNTEG